MQRFALSAILVLTLITACQPAPPTKTPTALPIVVASPTVTTVPTEVVKVLPTATQTSTVTPKPSVTRKPTYTLTPTRQATVAPSEIPLLEPTPEPTIGGGKLVGYYDSFCPTNNVDANSAFVAGEVAVQQGNLTAAEEALRLAIDLDAGFCDAMNNLALTLVALGRNAEAREWLERALGQEPDYYVGWMNLGLLYHFQERWDEALNAYQRVIDLTPENPEGYYGMGDVYYDMRDFKTAVSYLEQAENLYRAPESNLLNDAQYMLGLALMEVPDYGRAYGYLEPTWQAHTSDSRMYYALGLYYLYSEQDKDSAIGSFYIAEMLGHIMSEQVKQDLENL